MTSIQEEERLDNLPDSLLADGGPSGNFTLLAPAATIPPALTDIPDVMSRVKVENYLLQLATATADPSPDHKEPPEQGISSPCSPPLSPVGDETVSVSGGGPKLVQSASRDRLASEDEANVSVCSSRMSRMSDLSNLTASRFNQVGAFYGAVLQNSTAVAGPVCPFPEEWQYNTIPEVIENDEDIEEDEFLISF